MRPSADNLKTITLYIGAFFGILLVVPCWLLIFRLPLFKDAPIEILIACPVIGATFQFIWFRACLSPDKTSIRPKWW